MLAPLLRGLIRLWLLTLRYRRSGLPVPRPAILVFWHGDQLPLLGVRPEGPLVAPVSLSRDGELQARILGGLGIAAARGSSSRGGARAARALVRALQARTTVLLAVDGPRGPARIVKPGAAYLARRGGVPIVPVGVAVSRGWRLRRAWDRYLLPLPFARAAAVFGAPLEARAGEPEEAFSVRIGEALRACHVEARRRLGTLGRGREGGDF